MALILLIVKRGQNYKFAFLFSNVRLKWGHRFVQFKLRFKSGISNVCLRHPERGRERGHEFLSNVTVNYEWLLRRSNFPGSMGVHMYKK